MRVRARANKRVQIVKEISLLNFQATLDPIQFSQGLSQGALRTPLVVNCCCYLLVVLFIVGVWTLHPYQCAQNNSLFSSLFTLPLILRPRLVHRERYCSGSTPRPTFLQRHRPRILLCQRANFKYNTSKHWSTYSLWRIDSSRSGKRTRCRLPASSCRNRPRPGIPCIPVPTSA